MPRFMCDQAAALLAKLQQRAARNDVPGMTFDEPIWAPMDGPNDVLLTQFIVSSALLPVEGAMFPALVLSGRDQHDKPLPRWLYVGSIEQLGLVKGHFVQQADNAMSRARSAG